MHPRNLNGKLAKNPNTFTLDVAYEDSDHLTVVWCFLVLSLLSGRHLVMTASLSGVLHIFFNLLAPQITACKTFFFFIRLKMFILKLSMAPFLTAERREKKYIDGLSLLMMLLARHF